MRDFSTQFSVINGGEKWKSIKIKKSWTTQQSTYKFCEVSMTYVLSVEYCRSIYRSTQHLQGMHSTCMLKMTKTDPLLGYKQYYIQQQKMNEIWPHAAIWMSPLDINWWKKPYIYIKLIKTGKIWLWINLDKLEVRIMALWEKRAWGALGFY